MESAKRIIYNTFAQYFKSILTTVLALYSTRLVLNTLGVSDYGIYQLVAGVVAMLGFVTNALVITTQRYISYYYGENNPQKVKSVFINSLFIHLIFGFALIIILYLLKGVIFNYWLKIDSTRFETAEFVYIMTIIMLFISIVIAPFKAMFIARENIVFISIVEIFDSILKLALAIWLTSTTTDKLMFYSVMMVAIQILNLLVFAVYSLHKFEECTLRLSRNTINKEYIKLLCGFAGWTTYGMGTIVVRNQGIAIMLNHFFGTVINAAYGLAFQVYGAISFVSTSILNAMNPQIMKAEGSNNRTKMMKLAEKESLYSVTLLLLIAIPFIIEMPNILNIWLDNDVPEYTVMFCDFILIAFLLDQLTYGLNTIMQALGTIKTYILLMYTPKLLSLALVWLLLSWNYTPSAVMWLYLIIELIVSIMRLPYLRHMVGLSISQYIRNVFVPIIPLTFALCIVCMAISQADISQYRFLLTTFAAIIVGIITIWFVIFHKEERTYTRNFISKLFHKC